jgi:hypothetical protein
MISSQIRSIYRSDETSYSQAHPYIRASPRPKKYHGCLKDEKILLGGPYEENTEEYIGSNERRYRDLVEHVWSQLQSSRIKHEFQAHETQTSQRLLIIDIFKSKPSSIRVRDRMLLVRYLNQKPGSFSD